MAHEAIGIRGKVVVEVYDPGHKLVSRTEANNSVVDGGRGLLAMLLAGEAAAPSFSIVAGIGEKETVPDLTELFEPDGMKPLKVEQLKSENGVIKLEGSFPAADKDRQIREAGLELTCKVGDGEETKLYNRVLLKEATPVRKEQVLSMTWTLSFAQTTV